MIDRKKAEDIVRALRCTSAIAVNFKRAKSVCLEWSERITDDAADMLEALIEENDRLSEALMVLRIKVRGDCGVCLHRHGGIGKEPCASCIDTDERGAWQLEGDEEHGEP